MCSFGERLGSNNFHTLHLNDSAASFPDYYQLFYGDKRRSAAEGVRSRLLFPQSQEDILSLIGDSVDNWRTKQYDWYQERTNNIQY